MLAIMQDVSSILAAINGGDCAATQRLFPVVYEELRRLARSLLASEPAGQSIQPTDLVHEAFLRLVDSDQELQWNSRGHFFSAAARAMRRILIDNARRKQSLRRGGDRQRSMLEPAELADPHDPQFLLALNMELDRLRAIDPLTVDLVEMRFFAGLTIQETADLLEISVRTANRKWAFAKAWLYMKITENHLVNPEGVG